MQENNTISSPELPTKTIDGSWLNLHLNESPHDEQKRRGIIDYLVSCEMAWSEAGIDALIMIMEAFKEADRDLPTAHCPADLAGEFQSYLFQMTVQADIAADAYVANVKTGTKDYRSDDLRNADIKAMADYLANHEEIEEARLRETRKDQIVGLSRRLKYIGQEKQIKEAIKAIEDELSQPSQSEPEPK